MKKSIILAFGIGLLLASCSGGTNGNTQKEEPVYNPGDVTSIVEKNLPVYSCEYDSDNDVMSYSKAGTFLTYSINNSSIPYMEVANFVDGMANPTSSYAEYLANFEVSNEGDTVVITNPVSKGTLSIDFVNRKATYHNFTDFFASNKVEGYNFHYFGEVYQSGSLIPSSSITYDYYPEEADYTIDLSSYNIDSFIYEGKYYLPYDTLTILMATTVTAQFIYTADGFYIYTCGADDGNLAFNRDMKAKGFDWIDDEYMEYNYNNLALFLDEYYGVDSRPSRTHEGQTITYLDGGAYKVLEPYKADLISTEENKSNEALKKLISTEFDDGGHTTFKSTNMLGTTKYETAKAKEYYGEETYNTIYTKQNISKEKKSKGIDVASVISGDEYAEALAAGITPNGYYKEYDDTAYITFDSFATSSLTAVDPSIVTEGNYFTYSNTLFMYANEKIQNNEAIKNVIIDISTNGGGEVAACEFVSSWVNGGNHSIIRNTKTNSLMDYRSEIDVNGDGVFNEKDYLSPDINLYVIVSNGTFSAANQFACNIKDNRKENTYFIGSWSGGGSCSVLNTTFNYLGASFRISSQSQTGRVGSTRDNFVNVDSGVKADEKFAIANDNYAAFADLDSILASIHNN